MKKQILIFSTLLSMFAISQAQPIGTDSSDIKIEKQRLVKFPDEVDQLQGSTGNSSEKSKTKMDEAQHILQEIEKINNALGYVRKQTEQSKLPPILDSSQYLFPKPLMQPFHQQHHQKTDINGGTVLLPSIRSVRLDQQYISPYSNLASVQFNTPPLKQQTKNKNNTKHNGLFFHPNEVVLPAPQNSAEVQQLPTHFVIPVRLYKLNKEEYINKNTPQEFRVKGYKIVGDIDNFYGKAKQKNQEKNSKAKPKYHLFFLPREVALNEDSKRALSQSTEMHLRAKEDIGDTNSREEKVVGIQRPYKIQTTAMSSSTGGGSSSNVTTQIIRKRVIPKPLREPSTSEQELPIGGVSAVTTNTKPNTNTNINSNTNSKPTMSNPTHNSNTYNSRPGAFNIQNIATSNLARPNGQKNTTATNAIKTAFQNIFKLPFRQDNKPAMQSDMSGQMQQMLPFVTSRPQQPFYEFIGGPAPQKVSDYQWDDETSSSDSEVDGTDNSTEHVEKQIFGHRHGADQQTQMEALKQGGIIIQRLKVRKGGIAIAGPGGVATAGSGGTAIVGPGGYALTHPRSLTIAGPGAKIIAIPSSVDLKDALERTNPNDRSIPREGKVVATGPTVYYSPATGTDSTSEFDDKLLLFTYKYWETARLQTWPWSLGPTAPYRNPTYLNPNYLLPQERLLESRPPFRITPTYFVPLAIPSTSFVQLNDEVSAELIKKVKSQNKKEVSTKRLKAPITRSGDLKSDLSLLKAIRKINPQFVIEDIFPVQGQHILSEVSSEKLSNPKAQSAIVKTSVFKKQSKRKLKIPKNTSSEQELSENEVKVEAIGRTATSGTIPQVPFGTYFLPYFTMDQQDSTKTATLILEPHSKAVVGNGGTAVSTPISKAYLKRGVPTNVYFSPESVAIAGVGGKAHAQANLELDLVDF